MNGPGWPIESGAWPWTLSGRGNVAAGITRIILHRAPCYGTCPVYTVELRRTGRSLYEGEDFVERMGPHGGTLEHEDFDMLAAAVVRLGFFELDDEYTALVTDLPATTTVVYQARRRKAVYHYGLTGPAELWAIEMLIDAVAASIEWQPTMEGPARLPPRD